LLRPSHPCWFKHPDAPESAISTTAVLVRPSQLQTSSSALYFWTPSAYVETSKSAIPSEKFMYMIRIKTGSDSIQTEEISRDWWRVLFFFSYSKLQPDHGSICMGRLLKDLTSSNSRPQLTVTSMCIWKEESLEVTFRAQ
jgi:hypothetical protein